MEVSIDNEVEGSIDFAFPMTNTELRLATQLWLKDPSSAEKKYGPIGLWNVSGLFATALFEIITHFYIRMHHAVPGHISSNEWQNIL